MYKLKLAIRYFLGRRISILAVAAVALCVFIVVVVMTVMNGLVVEFKEKNHRFAGDCVVSTDSLVGFPYYLEFVQELEKQDFIKATSSVIRSYGLIGRPGSDWNRGAEIAGIIPADHIRATDFGDTLHYHKLSMEDAFVPAYNPDLTGCVVGVDMMDRGRNSLGEYFYESSPPNIELMISCFPLTAKGALAKVGTDLVNTMNFFFSDNSHSGLVKVDGNVMYVPFEEAQKLCGMAGETPRISAIHIRFTEGTVLKDGCVKVNSLWEKHVAKNINQRYAKLLNPVRVQSWIDNRRSTIAPMEKEQTMLILLFLMLGVITVFVIFVVFYMIISHKSKDIGILRSIGVSGWGVVELFVYFAVIVGGVGACIGAAGGCAFLFKANEIENWLFEQYGWQVWDRSVYAIGEIPNDIEVNVLAIIILSAVASSVLGALLPAVQAAMKKPAEVLQVNQI